MLLFKVRPKQKTYLGQQRVVKKFAILPTVMDDGHVIWLEKYLCTQEFKEMADMIGGFYYSWETIKKKRIRRNDEEIKG